MVNEDKIRKKAKLSLSKAEILMDNGRIKKSAKNFRKSAELFMEIKEWKIAEQCNFYASKNFHKLGGERNFHRAAIVERNAGNCCIRFNNFSKSRDYFVLAAKSILKSEAKNMDEIATRNLCFAFLNYFIQGKMEEGISYIKRFKSNILPTIYSEHKMMKLVINLTKALINHKEKYVDEIIDDFAHFKYEPAEMLIIKESLIVALAALMITFSLNMKTSEYERDNIIKLKTQLNFERLKEFKKYTTLARTFIEIEIIDIEIPLGDNLSTKFRPELPVKLDLSEFGSKNLSFNFRSNFPGLGFIGPIKLTMEIDGKYRFFLNSEKENIKIVSPEAELKIDLNPLKTPVINQTFPLQVIISNESEGDTMEIELEFEFPEDELRMMRGTLKKNIYQLSQNEQLKWQILVKAFEVGEIPIKTSIKFKDGDGNEKGPTEFIIPLNINL